MTSPGSAGFSSRLRPKFNIAHRSPQSDVDFDGQRKLHSIDARDVHDGHGSASSLQKAQKRNPQDEDSCGGAQPLV